MKLILTSILLLWQCFALTHGYGLDEKESREMPSIADRAVSFSFKLDLMNGNFANVFDNVVPFSLRGGVRNHGGRSAIFTLANYSWTQEFESHVGMTPWIHNLCTDKIKTYTFWKHFVPLLEEQYGKNLKLEHAQFEIAHALDARPPVIPQYCAKGRYIATIFLNTFWPNNNYGQLSFYAEMANKNLSSDARLEIIESVHPRGGRAAVYPSCQMNVFHPPTPSYFKHMTMLNVWFTTEDATTEPITNPISKMVKEEEERAEGFSEFTFKNPMQVDLSKALKRSFYDPSGKKGLYFYDDVFSTEELREWRAHLLKYSASGLNEYDGSSLEDNDNVVFMSQYKVSSFVKTEMWKRVFEQIKFITNEDQWYPYDVALNYIRSSDCTRLHPDSEKHQYEYTYLLYLTEGIETKHMGETIWVDLAEPNDGITQFTGSGGEEYEPHAAVKPKFGRVAIFYNNVEHSARPLRTDYYGDRYTFAVKVGYSKRNAYVKLCYEAFEAIETKNKKLQKLNRQLQSGMHDEGSNSKLKVDDLVKLHEKFLTMKDANLKKGVAQSERMITEPFDFSSRNQ